MVISSLVEQMDTGLNELLVEYEVGVGFVYL